MKNLILRKNNNLHNTPKNHDVWSLQSQINKMFDDFLSPFDFYDRLNLGNVETSVFPKINLAENEAEYKIIAELPGMDEEGIELTYEDNILTISGERKDENEQKGKGYYYKESNYGTFRRSIKLPENIIDDKFDARFKNGILTITAPKSKEVNSNAKKIEINAK